MSINETRTRSIERIREMVLDAFKQFDAQVWLFGSCARRDVNQASDIDVGVLPNESIPRHVFSRLVFGLEESTIPYDVDLVDLSHVAPEFLSEVQRTGIPWRK